MQNYILLFYTENYNKGRLITQMCRQFGIIARKIKTSDINVSLAGLAGQGKRTYLNGDQPPMKAPEGYAMPEIMIFSGFSREFMFEFLDAYKNAGIETISLKAVLTPYNFTWSLYQLIKELEREQAEMLLRVRGQKEKESGTGNTDSRGDGER